MADRLHTEIAPTVRVRGRAARRAMRRSFDEFVLGMLGPSGRGEIEIGRGGVGWWRIRRLNARSFDLGTSGRRLPPGRPRRSPAGASVPRAVDVQMGHASPVRRRRSSAAGGCGECGRPLDTHDRHFRFRLPEPVLRAPDQERTPGSWMTHDNPRTSVMMQVPGIGAFVRCLLPVKLSGGFTVTFGVWLAVHPEELHRAIEVWSDPAYAELTLNGRLANRLPLWDCLDSPAHASVEHPDHTPYLTSSTDELLARVLSEEWPHGEVLEAVPG